MKPRLWKQHHFKLDRCFRRKIKSQGSQHIFPTIGPRALGDPEKGEYDDSPQTKTRRGVVGLMTILEEKNQELWKMGDILESYCVMTLQRRESLPCGESRARLDVSGKTQTSLKRRLSLVQGEQMKISSKRQRRFDDSMAGSYSSSLHWHFGSINSISFVQ